MPMERPWSGLSSFPAAGLHLRHRRGPHSRAGLAALCLGATEGSEQRTNGKKRCFRNRTLALRCSGEPPPKTALQWWGAVSTRCQDAAAKQTHLLGCLGPLLLPFKALVCPRAWASLMPSLLTLLYLRVSSL